MLVRIKIRVNWSTKWASLITENWAGMLPEEISELNKVIKIIIASIAWKIDINRKTVRRTGKKSSNQSESQQHSVKEECWADQIRFISFALRGWNPNKYNEN